MINNFKTNFIKNMKNKNFSEILTGSIMTFSAKIFTVLLGFISNIIIAKYYGAEVLGTISILFTIMGIASIFSLVGMDVSVLRFLPPLLKNKEYLKIIITIRYIIIMVTCLGLMSAIIVYFSSDFIADTIFKKHNLIPFIIIISFFIFIQALSNISISIIRGLKKIKIFVILQFLPSLLNLVILLAITFFFYHKYNPLYAQLSAQFLIALFAVGFLVKFTSMYKNKINIDNITTISYKEILTISFPMFLTTAMHSIILQTDIIMLGSMSTIENVGVYSIVMKLSLLTSFIIGSVNTMIAPKFSELYYNDEMNELKSIARKSTKLVFYATLPIILILFFYGDILLHFFGNEFIVGYYALILLVIGQIVNNMAGSVGYMLNMTGGHVLLNKIVMISALSNILLNALLIPNYGINGAAFSSMFSIITWNLFASYYIKKHLGFSIGYIPLLTRSKQ